MENLEYFITIDCKVYSLLNDNDGIAKRYHYGDYPLVVKNYFKEKYSVNIKYIDEYYSNSIKRSSDKSRELYGDAVFSELRELYNKDNSIRILGNTIVFYFETLDDLVNFKLKF